MATGQLIKFQPGDSFYVKENGITGRVLKVEHGMNQGRIEYGYNILWDSLSRSGWYPASEVDDLWEFVDITKRATFQAAMQTPSKHVSSDTGANGLYVPPRQGIDFIPITLEVGDIKVSECEHEWAPYFGLRDSFEFCKKCDKKK